MRVLAVIPARMKSTRLPGKPLLDICGKPMIQLVYEAVQKADLVDDVLVATEDESIVKAVEGFGGRAVLTSPNCASGTDRLVEVADCIQADIYLNVQGDEPLVRPEHVDRLAGVLLERKGVLAATLCFPISADEALDPNLVKVVRDDEGNALYFSRARIPYDRDNAGAARYYGHMGMYAYRREALDVFGQNAPGRLETTEKLEQLRLLQKCVTLATVEVESPAPGVDTAEDLQRVRSLLSGADKGHQKGHEIKGHEIGARLETPFPGWAVASASSDFKDARALYEKLKDIELVLTDVDGVLTDGGLYYGADGEALKRFCSKDGLGISLLRQNGIRLAVVSGRDCPALRKRLDDLGISFFRLGESHKKAACEEILREANVLPGHALFVGDDLPDIEGFKVSGFGVAVGNAHEKAKDAADMVLQKHGGHGAFRELCDHLLAARGK